MAQNRHFQGIFICVCGHEKSVTKTSPVSGAYKTPEIEDEKYSPIYHINELI